MLKIVRLRLLSRDKKPTCCSCDAILVRNSLRAVEIFDLDYVYVRAEPAAVVLFALFVVDSEE